MELKEMIKVMQHYDNGGDVEYREKDSDKEWEIPFPTWNWDDFEYRIKESKQKVTIEKWLCEYVRCEELIGSKRFFIIEKIIPFEVAGKKVKLLETYEVELWNF